jgi:tetratricopeptide (TPR) repeat protein
MKNIFPPFRLIFVMFALVFYPSCGEEFLQVKPLGEINAQNFFQEEKQGGWAINAIYNQMRSWDFVSFPYLGMTDIVSDDAVKGSFPADAERLNAFDDFIYDSRNPEDIRQTWRGYYQAIFRANVAIDGIPKIPKMNETLRKKWLGEAHFLRAHFYFNLVRWFGSVPLITKPLTQDEFYTQERAGVEKLYEQIKSDLNVAISSLPLKSAMEPIDLGRVSKGSAAGLLAKVFLTQGDFTNAAKWAKEVIDSKEYSLYPDYARLFRKEGENGVESLFEIQATALEASYAGATAFNMVQGVRGSPNLGWGFNNPSDDLVRSYEPGDPRRDATVLYVGEVLPDGSGVIEDNPSMENERYNQKAWVESHPGLQDNGPGNIRILRYADVLLMAAEALNEINNPTEALKYLNQVRQRARGTRTTVLPDLVFSDKLTLRERIWKERRIELAMEQQRWFDLLRTGQVEKVMKNLGKNFIKGKHELFPIPQTEIDLSEGKMTQNPGY